jgi:hypothetical protein
MEVGKSRFCVIKWLCDISSLYAFTISLLSPHGLKRAAPAPSITAGPRNVHNKPSLEAPQQISLISLARCKSHIQSLITLPGPLLLSFKGRLPTVQ